MNEQKSDIIMKHGLVSTSVDKKLARDEVRKTGRGRGVPADRKAAAGHPARGYRSKSRVRDAAAVERRRRAVGRLSRRRDVDPFVSGEMARQSYVPTKRTEARTGLGPAPAAALPAARDGSKSKHSAWPRPREAQL